MTAAPTLSEVADLLAILQADPARRFVTAERYGGPAYGVYELPEDQNREHHRLIATLDTSGPIAALLDEAKLYGTVAPQDAARLPIRYDLGDVFTLSPSA